MSDNGKPGKPNGKKNGRPRKELPGDDLTLANAYQQIETMAGYGLTRKMMALILGVSLDTLSRRTLEDPELLRRLERGEALAGAQVAQCLYELATGQITVLSDDPKAKVYKVPPNLGAIIWYEKTRGGRSERFKVEDDRPGEGGLPRIPLTTLRAAVKEAQAAEPGVLRFRRPDKTA